MSKNWYSDELAPKLEMLYSLGPLEDCKTIQVVNDTVEVLESLIYGDEDGDLDLNDILQNEKRRMQSYLPYIKTIEMFKERESLSHSDGNYRVRELSIKDFKDITRDFFSKALDKELYNRFREIYRKWNRYIFINREDMKDFGESFYLPYFNEVYIRVRKINSVIDLCSLSHEFGHGIQYLTDPNPELFTKKEMFREIISTFFEFLMSDYLKSISEFKKTAVAQDAFFHDWRIKNCNDILKLDRLLDNWLSLKGNECAKRKSIDSDIIESGFDRVSNIDELISADIISYAPYVFAYVMASKIFLVYSKNKLEGLKLLKRIMSLSLDLPNEVYYQKLLDMGLGREKSVDEYEKVLKMECSINF